MRMACWLAGLVLAFRLCPPAYAGCIAAHVADVPFRMAGPYVTLPVTMNGATGNFLLDTGSQGTEVDTAFGQRAGIGMDRHAPEVIITGAGSKETLASFQGHVRVTQIGELKFQDWEYVILDLSWLKTDDAQIDGVLGMDFMHYFDVAFDMQTRMLTIYRLIGCADVHPPSWKGDYDTIPLKHTAGHTLTMPVYLDDAFLDLLLDTGAGSGVLLTRDAAVRAGADSASLANDDSHGEGFGGGFHTARHRFKTFLIGSAVHKDVMLPIENERTGRGERDGLIGLRALDAQRVWISSATSTLFLQRADQAK